MLLISLFFLFVYLFGAYAYGAASLLSIRQVHPVWGGPHRNYSAAMSTRLDKASMALFVVSAIWFVLHALIEFRNLTGNTQRGFLDLATFIVFLFPPLIMHTVYLEAKGEGMEPPRIFGVLLALMYAASPLLLIYMTAAVTGLAPRPEPLNPWIGALIGGLFTLTSMYSSALMLRMPRRERSPDQLRLRNVMIFLFIAMSGVFIALIFMREQGLLIAILDRLTRSAPIFFLIASVYYESRFDFYDLVVKRAILIMLSIVVVAVYLVVALQWMDRVPGGAGRPFLLAVALAPVAMVMPWLVARVEQWLDRRWLGRKYPPVEAVKQVLAAMQSATDETTLIRATETKLREIFSAPIAVLMEHEPSGNSAAEVDVMSPLSQQPVRIAVLKAPGMRRILSEDLALLRSLGGVFGFMLDNVRLQRKRQEQDQLAHELRLQSSRSELKALRAQINPHFLFNALNAIASLIHTDPARADEVVEQLAEVFRYTLRRSHSEWAPLDQELAFARAYLDVEQARFGPRLSVTIDSDHNLPAPQVPAMLLQTLIENAVKHGVSQAREAGRIDVIARTTADHVTMEVRNTGPSVSEPPVPGLPRDEGFGLHSVRERLKGHFGDRASFVLMRDEHTGVTVARISMPHVKVAA